MRVKYHARDITSVLKKWGFKCPPAMRPKLSSSFPRVRSLEPYKSIILQWHRDGLGVVDIRGRFKERYNKDALPNKIKTSIARWSASTFPTWRAIESLPGDSQFPDIPFLPTNVLTELEVQILKEAVREAYLNEPTPPTDPTSDWPERVANALCLDQTIQDIVVNEKLQPGCHWDSKRLLDPLWIIGIYLPGSYHNLNTESKVMSVTTRSLQQF